jgi:CheY-like chemotaxis protein
MCPQDEGSRVTLTAGTSRPPPDAGGVKTLTADVGETLLGRARDVARASAGRARYALGLPEPPADAPHPRVLCLDDSPDAADTLAALLDIAGFDPAVFYDPVDALAALDRIRPDACVLDVMMPGIDGLEVARRVRRWAGPRRLPLVAVTALGDDESRRATADAGFDTHLVKPVHPDRLAAVLADLLIDRAEPGPG